MSPLATICRCGTLVPHGEPHACEATTTARAHNNQRRNQRARRADWGPLHRKLRPRVLARDDHTCVRCGHEDPTGRTLVAHHLVYPATTINDYETLCLICSGREDGGRRCK